MVTANDTLLPSFTEVTLGTTRYGTISVKVIMLVVACTGPVIESIRISIWNVSDPSVILSGLPDRINDALLLVTTAYPFNL